MHHEARPFADQTVLLDGNTYTECAFVRCEMVLSGVTPPSITGCHFTECTWRFDGPAQNTMQFLAAAWTNPGMRPLIEQTLDTLFPGH